jgi:hypothetical protein
MNNSNIKLKSSYIPNSQPSLDEWCKMHNVGSRCQRDNSILIRASIANRQYDFINFLKPKNLESPFTLRNLCIRFLKVMFS